MLMTAKPAVAANLPLKLHQVMPGGDPLNVISVGCDLKLLSLREQIFRNAGLQVQTVTPEAAEALAPLPEPHVWIFCSSVGPLSLVHMASQIRLCSPASKLVLLLGKLRTVGHESALFERILDPFKIDLLLTSVIELACAGQKFPPTGQSH